MLWFDVAPGREEIALAAQGQGTRNTTMIPVGEVVKRNAEAEAAFGGTYRLIVFPAGVTRMSTLTWFTLRWTLVRGVDNRAIWTGDSSFNDGLYSPGAAERARIQVEGVVNEWLKLGLIK